MTPFSTSWITGSRSDVKLVDVNVLLYATNRRAPHHEQAKSWFDRTMSSGETVALPLVVTMAFVRLTTNRRVLSPPLSVGTSIDYVRGWLNHTTVTVPQPTNRHLEILQHLLESTGIGGNLVTDAHLATLAIEHGAELCSFDPDFARFPGLSWIDVRTA